MHSIGLAPATRTEPFFNLGGEAVGEFVDLTVDGSRLLNVIKQATSEHFDVITPVTREFPQGAVEFLDAMLGREDRWGTEMGAELGEVPIYVCPIDYDLLCGGIVATLTRTDTTVRLSRFRHTSTDDTYNARVTTLMKDLDYTFDRGRFDDVLGELSDEFVEHARTWVRPDHQVSAVRRLGRRLRRKIRG